MCKVMKVVLSLVIAGLCCAAPTWAGPWQHVRGVWSVRHYVATHKELLVSDALVTLALSADAASSVHAERICPTCVEENWILGPHPAPSATWTWALGEDVLLVGVSHLTWHYAPRPLYRHMIWMWTGPLVTEEIWNVKGNADIPDTRYRFRGPSARMSETKTLNHFDTLGTVRRLFSRDTQISLDKE